MGRRKGSKRSNQGKIITKIEFELYKKRESTLKKLRGNLWSYAIIVAVVTIVFSCAILIDIINGSLHYGSVFLYAWGYLLSIAALFLGFYLLCFLLGLYYSSNIFQYRVQYEGETYKSMDDEESVLLEKETGQLATKIYNAKKERSSWIGYSIYCAMILVAVFIINDYYYQFEIAYIDGKSLLVVFVKLVGQTALFAVPVCIAYFLACSLWIFSLEEELSLTQNQKDQNEAGKNIYEYSIKMSYKYLDQYYAQTRKQAKNGFAITCGVAVCGALIIGGGVIAMYKGVTEPAYVTTATGVIVEFIASIFFYLYNRTMQNMGDYHNKLVLSQNIAIALELVNSIGDERKDEVMSGMISELLKDINIHINENKPERKNEVLDYVKYSDKQNVSAND